MAADTIMGPVHPGEILLEEFLKPLSVSQYRLASDCRNDRLLCAGCRVLRVRY
jgi:hypothetical protein